MGVGGEPASLAGHRRSILVITPPTIAQMIALDQGLGAGEAAAPLARAFDSGSMIDVGAVLRVPAGRDADAPEGAPPNFLRRQHREEVLAEYRVQAVLTQVRLANMPGEGPTLGSNRYSPEQGELVEQRASAVSDTGERIVTNRDREVSLLV
jgi:hypothetical protein